jgi:hypothetical protein
MKKIIIAIALTMSASVALANCVTNTVFSGGRMTICTTCCQFGSCTTTCV